MTLKAFSASEDEMSLANQILLFSNCQESGALKPDAAIDIFKRSGLSITILRDIWNMADENASGNLTIHELTAAIRLMGWVQVGESLDESLLSKSGPLPTLDGVTDVVGKRNVSPPNSRFPPVNHDDMGNFKRTFNAGGPAGGFLDGDIVLEIYMGSNLSYGELWKIRKLVDMTERGALDFREFAMGMYLIQAIQSCYMASVPSTIPPELQELFSDPALLDLHPTAKRPAHSLQSKASLRPSPSHSHSQSQSQSQILPSVPESNIPMIPVHSLPDDSWDVSLIERAEAENHFQKLDLDHKGYIEGVTAANFMLSYKLSSADLAHIWHLVDLNGDNRLTKDAFSVAMCLINRKIAGEKIPATLPPSLVPPSMRSKGTPSSPPVPMSPQLLAKFKLPPPPPPKRQLSGVKRSATSKSNSLSSNPSTPERFNLPTPPLPNPKTSPITSPTLQHGPSTPRLSSNLPEVVSPFEDPTHDDTLTSRHPSPLPTPKPLSPDHSDNEALEEFKKEIARLTLQRDSLLSQLYAQNSLRDSNEALRNERDTLKAQMRDMERTVLEVLSANDQNESEEQYIQEISRLTAELMNRETQHESTERMLAALTGEDKDLRRQIRDLQGATAKAKSEAEDLRRTIHSQEGEITELRTRVADMGKAMSEGPESTTDNRELRVLFRDVTRENEGLKVQVRDMQQSMEQLLLSTQFHAKYDEVERENRRLKGELQELEMLATHLPSAANNSALHQQKQAVDEENEKLKGQLQVGHRAFDEFRTTSELAAEELRRKLSTMEHELNQLKMEITNSSEGQRQEDNTLPPPAYDGFAISP